LAQARQKQRNIIGDVGIRWRFNALAQRLSDQRDAPTLLLLATRHDDPIPSYANYGPYVG
jgi:hypothetical protein